MAAQSLSYQQLFNMMKLSENVNPDFATSKRMISHHNIINRAYSIEWMKKILNGESQEFVDMSIQIFDRFITKECAKDINCLFNTHFLCHAAACSVILSLKLLDSNSRNRFNVGRFHSFNTQELIKFEVEILTSINCTIYPLCTPRSFVNLIVQCCPPPIDVNVLLKSVNTMMNEFDEHAELLLFAPSTVAISVLLLAFSQKHLDCTVWLDSVPDFCLPRDNPLYRSYPDALNIEKCVNFLVSLPPMVRVLDTPSPNSVAAIL